MLPLSTDSVRWFSQTLQLAALAPARGTARRCARGVASTTVLAAVAMVYGGASHLGAADVEREKSARLGAPTREEVDAWELLQQDNRSDHIGPRVPDGRLPLPATDSSDCHLCHRTTTSARVPPALFALSTSVRGDVHLPPWGTGGC